MDKIVKASGILSWINLVIGGILVAGGLLGMLAAGDAMIMLMSVVLTASIVLHSYAALQLRKSIKNEQIPLSSQTITGIRLVGFMALFFAILNIGNAVVIIQNAAEVSKQAMENFLLKTQNIDMTAAVRGAGIFSLIFSIGIAVNVFLSIRMLRAYLASREQQ